ncbi:hypothetical protein D3218_00630 [Aureimonas flava]|uniref:DUF2946 domain-containing protein n=1 Tax=Aureimonas flava TaxID=2320271 RepID=A0A3A1WX47_9HYPH|nr:hypothetical protein [Aureimonas flava]RIY03309.1 hypothetical protein D3218_00630 [Aureimonas flava]
MDGITGGGRWLLALVICAFAFSAPEGHAMPAVPHPIVMGTGCAHGDDASAARAPERHAAGMAACCVAHCLLAVPLSPPAIAVVPEARGTDDVSPDERAEGRSVPVPLPPPRGARRT